MYVLAGEKMSSLKQASNLIQILKNELSKRFVEKDVEINALLVGLLSREPVIIVGLPGTAKTKLIETLAKMINCKYFVYLLTRYTEPDEIFGPIDINALREGKYIRIMKNTILDADVVFLDEIFKASSAIRNTLLRILNEKKYTFTSMDIPVNWLGFYSASNEISTDSEDQALYDRLVIRIFTHYVSATNIKELLMKGIELEDNYVSPVIMKEEVQELQRIVSERFKMLKNDSVLDRYIEALMELRMKGIELSDRRKIKVLKVATSISVLYGATDVTLDDVAEALRLVAPHSEDDIPKIEEVIARVGLSALGKLSKEIETLITELNNITKKIEEAQSLEEFRQLRQMGTAIIKQLQEKLTQLANRNDPRVDRYLKRIKDTIADFKHAIEKKLGE